MLSQSSAIQYGRKLSYVTLIWSLIKCKLMAKVIVYDWKSRICLKVNIKYRDRYYISINTPLYIHSESNHPPSIIKQLPSMINKRISNLSCNEHEFYKAKPIYESALKSSEFNCSMKFKALVEKARRNRNRKVIWFNPPYSLNVNTNIGKAFRKLVRKHFPRSHKLSKIFNLNTIKIS